LRLVNVARASLEELLLDYEDYLRQRGHRQWEKEDREAKRCAHWARISLIGPIGPTPWRHWKAYAAGWSTTIRRWWPTP